MEVLVRNVISVLLQTAWAMQLFFSKFHAVPSCTGDTMINTSTIEEIANPPQNERISPNLLFSLDENGVINLSDVITPDEEEMLRCACAKGYARPPHRRKKLEIMKEACISRDTFTNIWLDSCCTV